MLCPSIAGFSNHYVEMMSVGYKSAFSFLTQEWYEDIWLMTAYHLSLAGEDKKKR